MGRPDEPPAALDDVWRPRYWRALPGHPERSTALEIGIVGLIAAYNYLSNRVLPEDAYVPSNLALAGVLLWMSRRAGVTWEEMGLRRDRMGSGLKVGLAAAGIVAAVLVVGAALPFTRSFFADERVIGVTEGEAAYQALVRIPIGTALFEEIVFRGVLLGLFLRHMSPLRAVTVSSVLFGLWHVLPTIDTLETNPAGGLVDTPLAVVGVLAGGVVLTTAAGYGFSWLRFRGRSLLAPILTHISTNSLAFGLAYLLVKRGWA